MAKTRAQQPTKPKPQPKGKGKARAAPTAAAPAPPVPSPKTRLSKATKTPLPRESSEDLQDKAADAATSDEDDEALDALLQGEDVEMDEGVALEGEDDSDEDDDSDDDDDEEEDDVTEEALERMMKLLGPVDAAELGLLDAEDEEEGSDDEEEGSEDDEEREEEEEEAEDAELKPYEELDEVDPDVAPVEKNVTNDKVALERVLASFKTDAGFFDTLTLTNPKALNVPDADNDLERELEFYKQSLWAAMHAEQLFTRADLPFHRPADYFAEMVKTDAHMAKIRQGLLDEQAGMKASEEARKLRDAKKFGKKVQVERLRERERDKKAVGDKLESLKKKRKGDSSFGGEDFDVALEDALASAGGPSASKKRKPNESERPGRARKGISRAGRDKKYGFGGGAGRRSKQNNMKEDDRSGGGGGGGGAKGKGGGFGGGKGGGKSGMARKRPGKSRRQAV
ncbi:eukaryotic rRNA processing protein EBP2-domain-containing protein [Rhodotorula diobovata]|uniref:Eukaryotic rRNA processing protein EBP2-domain-containing protein n=1 Tax=Rhodotorula diobovata TaxID=5288 RepID=A0A5C5FN59_9BASI|nr:eukaryotic rRNA processing protein EBP2-domain-containing protein [Rhodotorula diobovata]